ncbi:eukaryotic translation initiation factor 5 [Lodderomyces elongisporus NRRL YB-4239]|uniref:Eukaryotic translation initiation factor 5 n=1 Tax=Lodderomyces elongisporus (strain ATCC 11503 / CBS 2605 / JCM 1781 / NBRC 1676 / NRRL YB-4239) TaxID=379508 RepID=A5E3G8_LODEL|nr:eukaryotic translation initiation factor 5 [Lodderomyces elongisporus NRRL YB-4239]
MSFINICRDNTDPFYRYKMPPIQSKTEGRGNGIKTAIPNLGEVARALNRPPSYLVKFFGYELGAQTQIDRFLVNGAHDTSELQDSLDGFINKFVLCGSCKNPETEIVLKGKDTLERDCKACGKVTIVDPKHKLYSYIVKNPPDNKKGKKSATATANVIGGGKSISDIAAGHENDGSAAVEGGEGDDDDDDLLAKKINAEAAQLAELKIKDDEWAVDMSQEAIAARARELESGLNATVSKFDEFGEWILSESGESTENLPSDVEIYKKIVELDIVEDPETLQVLAQTLFDEDILNQIEPHVGLLAKLINGSEEFEKSLLGGLERFIGITKPELIPQTPKILHGFYDRDLLSEEVIVPWGSKVSKKYVPKDISKKVRKAAKPFVQWLQEAEEEESDEDEE